MYYHEDLCVGCSVHALLYLYVCCVNVGLGCCCVMSVHTSRGSCNSWENHTAKTVGLLEVGDVGDSMKNCSGVLTGVRESRKGRMSWRGQDGRSGVEEGWAWEDKGEMRHWVRGKRRTLQEIKLDISLQMKEWKDGQNREKGIHRDPGGRWKVVQDWEWPRERGYYCLHCNSPGLPGTAQTPLDLQ